MEIRELEIWWSSLPINEKERIARKGNAPSVTYPGCTSWWNSLPIERQESIYHHCVAHHGDALKEWKEGNPYGD